MRVLVVNAGSSSLKLSLIDHDDGTLASVVLGAPVAQIEPGTIRAALAQMPEPAAVGHRIVHGGARFDGPTRIDNEVQAALRDLSYLAPLHQPTSLAALDIVSNLMPHLPAVAAFDTAFHSTLPPAASTYAIPRTWRERFAIRRYGFHGLSHAYAAGRVSELHGDAEDLRLVTCHLGAGASLAAVRGGHSIETTMGFTPLEGLVMATRSGSIDPGLILWLIEHGGIDPSELLDDLEHRSGLTGLAGTGDMRELLAREDRDAKLALEIYVHHLRAGIASMAAALAGMDAIVFTGGVGENSPPIRARATDGLRFLGVVLDPTRNQASGDRQITADGSPVRAYVVAAREDLEIARQVRSVISAAN